MIELLDAWPLVTNSSDISICGGVFDGEPGSFVLFKEVDDCFWLSICALRMLIAWVASVAEKVLFFLTSAALMLVLLRGKVFEYITT